MADNEQHLVNNTIPQRNSNSNIGLHHNIELESDDNDTSDTPDSESGGNSMSGNSGEGGSSSSSGSATVVVPHQQLNLLRIVYTSRLTTHSKTRALVWLNRIFHVSDVKNKQLGISSILFCNLLTFNLVQVLEGPIHAVTEVFMDIARNRRHTRVNRVMQKSLDSIQDSWLFDPQFKFHPDDNNITTHSVEKVGLKFGSRRDWNFIKVKLANEMPGNNFPDLESPNLRLIDKLPLAGDFDVHLLRIVYCSEFTESNPEMAFYLMQNIVEHSSHGNEQRLIGGILHMSRQQCQDPDENDPTKLKDLMMVLQCLEGPKNVVEELFGKIRNDLRHHNIMILSVQTPKRRRYKTFGMIWASKEALKNIAKTLSSRNREAFLKLFSDCSDCIPDAMETVNNNS